MRTILRKRNTWAIASTIGIVVHALLTMVCMTWMALAVPTQGRFFLQMLLYMGMIARFVTTPLAMFILVLQLTDLLPLLYALALVVGLSVVSSLTAVMYTTLAMLTANGSASSFYNWANDRLFCCKYYDVVPECLTQGPCVNNNNSMDLNVKLDAWVLLGVSLVYLLVDLVLLVCVFQFNATTRRYLRLTLPISVDKALTQLGHQVSLINARVENRFFVHDKKKL